MQQDSNGSDHSPPKPDLHRETVIHPSRSRGRPTLLFPCGFEKRTCLVYSELVKFILGDLNRMEKVLQQNGNRANAVEPGTDSTALMFAVLCGHAKAVSLLLKYGADVNFQERRHGWTALLLSVLVGYLDDFQKFFYPKIW